MRRFAVTAVVAASIVLALAVDASGAPAQAPDPIVDLKGVNADKYAKDLSECRALADTALAPATPPPTTATEKAKAGVTGVAKAGAKAVAANGLNVIKGAGTFVKEVSGENAANRKRTVVANCLKGRGYAVLD